MLVGFQHVIIAFYASVFPPKSLKHFKGCVKGNIQQYLKKGAPWIKTTFVTRTFYKKIIHCWTYFHSSSLQIANSLKLLWDLTNSCSAPSAESRASSNDFNLVATH